MDLMTLVSQTCIQRAIRLLHQSTHPSLSAPPDSIRTKVLSDSIFPQDDILFTMCCISLSSAKILLHCHIKQYLNSAGIILKAIRGNH